HHTVDTERAVEEVHRVLRPGGEAIVMLYNKYSWFNLVALLSGTPIEHAEKDAPIIRRYSTRECRRLFGRFAEVAIHVDRFPKRTVKFDNLFAKLNNYLLVPFFELLPVLLAESKTGRIWQQQALLTYLSLQERSSLNPSHWLGWVLRQAARQDGMAPQTRLESWRRLVPTLPPSQVPTGLAEMLEALSREVSRWSPAPPPPGGDSRGDRPQPEDAEREKKEKRPRRPMPGDEAIYVPHAGIVLVWPFFPHFFQQAELLRPDRKFRDETANQRAIHLLQYLINKQTDAPEERLVLNKILCGWPLSEPVVGGIDISEAEISLAEGLIEAARQRWGPLKHASNDGMRGSFFIREGKLTHTSGENWQLVVAQKPFDLLLDQLPWNLSMVRLPWMRGLLTVEWR
ncbi:MAG: hypothetical protein D6722_20460, partial [Bacteroidetes bacterium]